MIDGWDVSCAIPNCSPEPGQDTDIDSTYVSDGGWYMYLKEPMEGRWKVQATIPTASADSVDVLVHVSVTGEEGNGADTTALVKLAPGESVRWRMDLTFGLDQGKIQRGLLVMDSESERRKRMKRIKRGL